MTGLQKKNLRESIPLTDILDRLAIVLFIFEIRAQTVEAQLQIQLVELKLRKADLSHNIYEDYDQQRGGTSSVSGGGESKIEIEKRIIRTRMAKIKKELSELQQSREIQRKSREMFEKTVGIVGYTNSGKTTLLNRLSAAKELAKNELFSSLSTTTRKIPFYKAHSKPDHALLLDTVGFVPISTNPFFFC